MRRSIAPWVALAGALLLTVAAAAFLFTTARTRDRLRFARAVRSTEDRIQARFEMHTALLRGTAALLAAAPEIDPGRFHDYVARLDLSRNYPGLQGIGFARRVRRAESVQVEGELRARGLAEMGIWPDAGREERTAIVWLEPLERRNRAAIGYDMSTEPVRREAMERARDTGRAALSGRVTLVQEIDQGRQPGFLLYVPVYRGGAVPATLQERRDALIGWAYSPFRAGDLFQGIFGADRDPLVAFRVYDGAGEDPDRLLLDLPPLSGREGRLRDTVQMQFGGRAWTLAFVALPALSSGLAPVALALIAGAAISVVIFLLSLREVRARQRAEQAVSDLRSSLGERARFEVRLREEGRVNSILRRLGIALAAELDPDRLAQLATDEAAALTGAELGAMFDARRRRLAVSGTLRSEFPELALQPGSAAVESALSGERAVRTSDPEERVFAGTGGRLRGHLAAPVVSRTGGVLAGLFFGHSDADHFTEQHERLVLGLAAQASIAMDNARLLRDLQEADRRKDEFLAVLGHELRNPLAPVVTALEVSRLDPRSAPRQLGVIERQARHMVRIVDDLLDVSRITRGKIELRKRLLPVQETLAGAADAVAPLARARQQKLTVTPPPEPLVIEADPVRLEQILVNLLTNAIKYTPEGGEVRLSAEGHGPGLRIQVRDTGIGIPPEAQKVLFDPFVQISGARDFATGGLGIGLALVKGLVELHGGSVEVESEGPGKGAVFTVRLPGAAPGRAATEPRHQPPRAKQGRVLVVDDNVDAALTLCEAVKLDGHDVRVAHEGTSALEQAAEFSPEVVLLDIGLPGLDGYEVARRLRRLPQLRQTMIVALTGFGQESDRRRALESGFDEHLVKPVDLDTVHAVLQRRLGSA